VSARALEQFAGRAQLAAGVRGDVDVLITSNAKMHHLNRQFRGKNAATDVLSFPSVNGTTYHGDPAAQRNNASKHSVPLCLRGGCSAGDIAISADIGARNARRLGHSLADELKVLILHGLLHLAGYDHETDAGEMARKEARLRRKLGLPTALIERTAGGGNIHHRGTERRRVLKQNVSASPCLRGGFSGKRRRS
jgi:probable rRNA maturation factor